MIIRVLICAPKDHLDKRMQKLLHVEHLVVTVVPRMDGILKMLGAAVFDCLVVQERCLPHPHGEWVDAIRGLPDPPEIILLREAENAENRARWLSKGVMAVLNQTLTDQVLGPTLWALLNRIREILIKEMRDSPLKEPFQLNDFATQSPRMRELIGLARRVAAADSSLLIFGETGVGKEWLAQAIHNFSPRRAMPFIAVNCAAIPETLLESELFGHERGAFTGAQKARRGYFEMAHQGTLFLDEIGDMPLHLQIKLLRVLQERRIQRLGSEASFWVDVRVIAATNKDLNRAMEEGHFRRDLFYRLSVVSLEIPPLRQRQEDIPGLALIYLRKFANQFKKPVIGCEPASMQALQTYSWPGNVRELINVMERAVLLAQESMVVLADLPPSLAAAVRAEVVRKTLEGEKPVVDTSQSLKEAEEKWLTFFEQEYLRQVLHQNRGHLTKTAAQAGIQTRTLFNKMRKWGWSRKMFKHPPTPSH